MTARLRYGAGRVAPATTANKCAPAQTPGGRLGTGAPDVAINAQSATATAQHPPGRSPTVPQSWRRESDREAAIASLIVRSTDLRAIPRDSSLSRKAAARQWRSGVLLRALHLL